MRPTRLEVVFAFLFTAAALGWMGLERALGWHDEQIGRHPVLTLLFMPIAIAVYVLLMRRKRRQLGGALTWAQGFAAGMWVTVFVALLSPLAQWLTHRVISPSYFANAIRYAVDNDLLTQQEAEASFNLPSYVLQAAAGALVAGAVTSAVVAALVRRQPSG